MKYNFIRKLKAKLIDIACLFNRDYRILKESGLFDRSYYLSENPDVAQSVIDPLVHYFRYGVREERNPNPMFDVKYYFKKYPEIKRSGINPLIHYARLGPDRREDLNRINREFDYQPKISIIALIHDDGKKSLEKFIRSIIWQYFINWELCIVCTGRTKTYMNKVIDSCSETSGRKRIKYVEHEKSIVEALNKGIRVSDGEFIVFANTKDQFSLNSFYEVVRLLNEIHETDVVYSDEDRVAEDGLPLEYISRPDWSPEFFRGALHEWDFILVRRELAVNAGLFKEEFAPVHFWEFLLRLGENTDKIFHIPKVLYHRSQLYRGKEEDFVPGYDLIQLHKKAASEHLKRIGLSARVEIEDSSRYMEFYPVNKDYYPLVSIIIPFMEDHALIKKCIENVCEVTSYKPFELLLGNCMTGDRDSLKSIEMNEIKMITGSKSANLSSVVNECVNSSEGDYVIILDENSEIITPEWIQNLLFYAEQPDVAAVGPYVVLASGNTVAPSELLRFRDSRQYSHTVKYYPKESLGKDKFLECAHEVPFVPIACLMMKKDLFLDAGGLNEHLFNFYQDVDLGLRFRDRGYRNIYTPTAVVRHNIDRSLSKNDYIDRNLILDQWRDVAFLD